MNELFYVFVFLPLVEQMIRIIFLNEGNSGDLDLLPKMMFELLYWEVYCEIQHEKIHKYADTHTKFLLKKCKTMTLIYLEH